MTFDNATSEARIISNRSVGQAGEALGQGTGAFDNRLARVLHVPFELVLDDHLQVGVLVSHGLVLLRCFVRRRGRRDDITHSVRNRSQRCV